MRVTFRNIFFTPQITSVDRHSSVGMVTELRAGRSGDRTPVGGEIFPTRPDRTCGLPASFTKVTENLQGVKRPGSGVDHNRVREAKESVELCLSPHSVLRGLFQNEMFLYLYKKKNYVPRGRSNRLKRM